MASTLNPPRDFYKVFTNNYPPPKIGPSRLSYNYIKVSKRMHCISTTCFSMRRANVAVACSGDAGSRGPWDEHGALEAVLKLYEAIKNKNVNELSDIIAEECLCVSNFVSAFQPFLGKKQVLAFFSCLIKNLGNNLQFVVEQTVDDGMVVAVSWKLEWRKAPLHLGKGISLYTCHVYQGKVMIKNVEIFLEPVLHIEPLRMRLISLVMTAMEQLNPQATLKNKTRKVIIFLVILILFKCLLFGH